MLTHLAVHGLFDLSVQAKGDLHIDAHHTVEDVALALGQAFDQALGDRKGIVRMGDCFAPMDETLAHVAIDLSGRPYAVIQAEWHTPYMGNIPTTLFPHFFESFAVTSRCNLHRACFIWPRRPSPGRGIVQSLCACPGCCHTDGPASRGKHSLHKGNAVIWSSELFLNIR